MHSSLIRTDTMCLKVSYSSFSDSWDNRRVCISTFKLRLGGGGLSLASDCTEFVFLTFEFVVLLFGLDLRIVIGINYTIIESISKIM